MRAKELPNILKNLILKARNRRDFEKLEAILLETRFLVESFKPALMLSRALTDFDRTMAA
jgi:hypothetical protein